MVLNIFRNIPRFWSLFHRTKITVGPYFFPENFMSPIRKIVLMSKMLQNIKFQEKIGKFREKIRKFQKKSQKFGKIQTFS